MLNLDLGHLRKYRTIHLQGTQAIVGGIGKRALNTHSLTQQVAMSQHIHSRPYIKIYKSLIYLTIFQKAYMCLQQNYAAKNHTSRIIKSSLRVSIATNILPLSTLRRNYLKEKCAQLKLGCQLI